LIWAAGVGNGTCDQRTLVSAGRTPQTR
jgi:hypothetical protein